MVDRARSGVVVWGTGNMGRAAIRAVDAHPDLDLIIYHSGFDVGPPEAAYDPDNGFGVDRLITSVREAGIEPGPALGEAVRELAAAQWCGEVSTREQAIAHMRDFTA